MRPHMIIVSLFFMLGLSVFSHAMAKADTITGAVRGFDHYRRRRLSTDGLSGAKVTLRRPGGTQDLTPVVITDAYGRYSIPKVSKGAYIVFVTLIGYIPRPHDRTRVLVPGRTKADDVFLVKEEASITYYSTIAAEIKYAMATVPKNSQAKELARIWEFLGANDLPDGSRETLVRELYKQYPSAKELLPDLQDSGAINLVVAIGNIAKVDDTSPTSWAMSGFDIVRIQRSDGAFTPIMRTELFDARTVEILSRVQVPPLSAKDIKVIGGAIVVRRYLLMTAKPQDAQAAGTSVSALAHRWAASVRRVLPQIAPLPSRFGI